MVNGQIFFDQPIKNCKIIYDNIRKIAAGQGDDCATGCLLDYPYFKEHCKMIVTDLSKQQLLQINYTRNLDWVESATMFSLLKKPKKMFWIFHKEP